jgi:hypothetical protein
MRKFLLVFLALFITAGIPMVHADDGGKPKPGGEEKEPECD